MINPESGTGDQIKSQYSELVVNLHERIQPFRNYYLIFRVFNDGIAYRYILLGNSDTIDFDIISEYTEFRFSSDITVFSLADSIDSDMVPIEISPGMVLDLPLGIRVNDGLYAAISESGTAVQTGMQLTGDDNDPFMLKTVSAGSQDVRYSGKAPLETSWRVILISDDPEKLMDSHIISILNTPEGSEK